VSPTSQNNYPTLGGVNKEEVLKAMQFEEMSQNNYPTLGGVNEKSCLNRLRWFCLKITTPHLVG